MENVKRIEKINEAPIWFFEKIKSDKTLARWAKK